MENDRLSRKLAVIIHADVVGSTTLVQINQTIAHERIQTTFSNFARTISIYNGKTREIRGDAILAEFEQASDAVSAALAFQIQNEASNSELVDDIQPRLRIGISLGEQTLKGFDQPVRAFAAKIQSGKDIPAPESIEDTPLSNPNFFRIGIKLRLRYYHSMI